MKKRTLSILLASTLVAFALTGCADESAQNSLSQPESALSPSVSDEETPAPAVNNSAQPENTPFPDAETLTPTTEAPEIISDEPEILPSPEPTKDEAVSYSTNNQETAKEGNSGVFSYKKAGGTYDIYWIVDFDEGFVYYFTEGNGNDTCDRLKIDSGDLNSVLIITYHDGGDSWSYGLHFHYKNHPNTLIVQDNDGFETKFVPTNLNDALETRDSKNIKDY